MLSKQNKTRNNTRGFICYLFCSYCNTFSWPFSIRIILYNYT